MDIQKLKYFISAAKHLSFTKAAQECFITQAAMSRQIALLEKEIGEALFYREGHSVQLTPAGRSFYGEAVYIYGYYQEALQRIKNAKFGILERIKIGIGPYEGLMAAKVIEKFAKQYPNVGYSCIQLPYGPLVEALDNGSLDFIFCQNIREKTTDNSLKVMPMGTSVWNVAVYDTHPWSEKQSVSYEDFTGQTLVTMDMVPFEDYRKYCMRMGFTPGGYVQVNSLAAKIMMVSAGLGVAFLPACMKSQLPEDVKLISLEKDMVSCTFEGVAKARVSNPAVHLLCNLMESANG